MCSYHDYPVYEVRAVPCDLFPELCHSKLGLASVLRIVVIAGRPIGNHEADIRTWEYVRFLLWNLFPWRASEE